MEKPGNSLRNRLTAAFAKLRSIFNLQTLSTAGVFCAAGVMAFAVGQYSNRINVSVNGVTRTLYSQRTDASVILKQHFIDYSDHDEVLCRYDENGNISDIVITPAFEVSVSVDGELKTVNMLRGTAQDALKKADISLGDLDQLECEPTEAVYPGMTIAVKRVERIVTTVTQVIPYDTVYQETSLYDNGVKKTEKAGKNGEKTITTTLTYMDGVLIDSSVKEKVTAKPTNAIVVIGSDEVIPFSDMWFDGLELDENGIPTSYKTVKTGVATAYGAKDGSKTSTGVKPGVGYIAVNPKVIPYGSKLYIRTPDGQHIYGCAIAADTGPSVMKNLTIADLYIDSNTEIWKWGRRTVEIYILE